MVNRQETLTVAVKKQVLWVGAEAYPVSNIARAQTIELQPRRARAVFRFLGLAVLWTALAVAAVFGIDRLGEAAPGVDGFTGVPLIVGGILILINLVGLIRTLARRTLYALVIETSGSPHSALITRDEEQLKLIVRKIMDAINNPQVSYGPISVQNYQVEKVGIIGDHGTIRSANM